MSRFALITKLLLVVWLGCAEMPFAGEPPEDSNPVQIEPEKPAETVKPITPRTGKRRARQRLNIKRTPGNEVVEVGKDVTIAAGETVGELVVIGGNATIDGTVEGNLVVVSGSAKINGQVDQDLVTILGMATLGPQAHIGHDVMVVGGPLRLNPDAVIGGRKTVVAIGQKLPNFMWLQNWVVKGLFLARPFPPQIRWVWLVAVLFLLIYLAMATMFPRPVRASVEILEHKPVASFFVGILVFILLGPLLLLLVASVAGILVIPFVFCALIVAGLFGKVAVYSYAGQQAGRQMQFQTPSLPLVLLLGAVAFYLIYMVPILGFAVWGIVTLIGLGAVLLAAFSSVRHEQGIPAPELATVSPPLSPEPAPAPDPAVSIPKVPPLIAPSDLLLLPRVGFWLRLCATLLDFVLLALLIPYTGPLFVIIWAAYYILMWSWKGTSIGGIVLGIKILRVDGQPLNFAVAFVRSLSSFFSAFALFLGFFWAGWDRERQAWHDKIAGTVVVKVPRGVSLL